MSKSITELLEQVDTSYMTASEKLILEAQAQRSEYIAEMVASAVSTVKGLFKSKSKATVAAQGLRHA
jgi:hypothetical protein